MKYKIFKLKKYCVHWLQKEGTLKHTNHLNVI